MYDDKDSEARRCDNCKSKDHKDSKCRLCSTNHIRFSKGRRLPYWKQEDKEDKE